MFWAEVARVAGGFVGERAREREFRDIPRGEWVGGYLSRVRRSLERARAP